MSAVRRGSISANRTSRTASVGTRRSGSRCWAITRCVVASQPSAGGNAATPDVAAWPEPSVSLRWKNVSISAFTAAAISAAFATRSTLTKFRS